MANKIRGTQTIDFDSEKHIKGPFCWCNPNYREEDDTYYHKTSFHHGQNVHSDKDIRA